MANFADLFRHSELDTTFHTVMYQRHYNRHAAELWWKHREVLRAVSRRFNFTLARRAAIMREHRELIAHVKAGEADKAAELIGKSPAELPKPVIRKPCGCGGKKSK